MPSFTAGASFKFYEPLVRKFQRLLEEEFKGRLISLVLYGSVARGMAGPESDIDLLAVVGDETENPAYRAAGVIVKLQSSGEFLALKSRETWPTLSCLALTRLEAGEGRWLFLDMVDDAVLLKDEGGFFRDRLERLRGRMRDLGSEKIRLPDGSWYWNVKPDLRPGESFEL
ncbi:MAG: nucleotidyltransferase domain-containing protein [Elusimicrobia bacterium]|nr:nucleotidyltransferase domain-containing protein [Elusimicrobiota bacterium]